MSDDELAVRVAAALQKRNDVSRFDPALAARFEADTRVQRIRHLRWTILLGLVFFTIYDLSGFVTLPHFAWANVVLRSCVMTPTALGIVYAVGRVSGRTREAITSIGMMGAAAIPLLFFVLSDEPLAPFMIVEIILSTVYANTTLGLRFGWACALSAITVAAVSASLCFKPELSMGMAGVIFLNLVTGTCYSLAANYRIELGSRRTYLLTLQELLRVKSLTTRNDALAQLSTLDALTGLFNRRSLEERTPQLNDHIARGGSVAVMILDVDHFKAFNDFYGHALGDDCLRRLSAILRREHSGGDIAIRFGGEEFLIVLPDRTSAVALAIAGNLCSAVLDLGIGHEGRADGVTTVTISVGVSGTDIDGAHTLDALIRSADAALYEAKSTGRNRACRAYALHSENRLAVPVVTSSNLSRVAG